ncbi:hypothetical protein [Robbsia sp. KACC 23696]|uniref:hypothetical protein n=1 Tax=Robbsia sp. KACC 23696 TaxID=3149231 RepID=UPI00325BE1BB
MITRGAAWVVLPAALLLGACATQTVGPAAPPGTVLSRLPAGTPGAATPTPDTEPSEAEKADRYNQIDRQALREQEQSIDIERAAAAAVAAAPRYYGAPDPWYPSYYGGYDRYGRGGWGYPRSGWSVGVGNGWGW